MLSKFQGPGLHAFWFWDFFNHDFGITHFVLSRTRKKKAGMVVHACNLSTQEAEARDST
jgi:hypothetical protein